MGWDGAVVLGAWCLVVQRQRKGIGSLAGYHIT
jgi:hypothetical protein